MTFKLHFRKTPDTPVQGSGRTKARLTFISTLLFIALVSYLLYIPEKKTIGDATLNIGDIANEDITVQSDTTIEDKQRTEENRRQALKNVSPIYEYYPNAELQSRDSIIRWFSFLRSARKSFIKNPALLKNTNAAISREFGLQLSEKELTLLLQSNFSDTLDLNQLLDFLNSLYQKRIVTSMTGIKHNKQGAIKLIIPNGEPQILKTGELLDLKKTEAILSDWLRNQEIPEPAATLLAEIIRDFIEVNISYSSNLTQEEEKHASASINPVSIRLKANKVILRKGDEITPEIMNIIRLITVAEEKTERRFPAFLMIVVIMTFLSFFGIQFYKHWCSDIINKDKILIVMGATLLVSVLIYRVCRFLFPLVLKNINLEIPYDMQTIFLALPFGFGALVIAFIFDLHSGVIFSFINAIAGGIVCNWDFQISLCILISNLAVVYGIEYYQRLKRSPIIKAAVLWMLPATLILVLTLNITGAEFSLPTLSLEVIIVFFAAVISPTLATFIIPLWETVFRLVTDLKLIELTNLNLPIFREMLEKAPGTYHHSQMVASLSEAAAQDLGISPLLLTAMALYHDIGKIDGPHFFTENHSLYPNPHKSLSPQDSAKNITAHIREGIDRAAKLKLPEVVANSIKQHHGTKVVRFFYDKARDMSSIDSDGFDDKAFRYQGDRPKNIENAIIMLADQVEAASKSLANPTDEELKNVLRKIIETNIEENQFDECEDLTFRALNNIANSFHRKLSSIYHMRISYPGFDFKEKEEKTGTTSPGYF